MATIPKTSVTLLAAIAASPDNRRWYDFYDRYQPLITSFLNHHFSTVEAEEIVQETMIEFMNKVPTYIYDPQRPFHNYLIGIAKFKALGTLRRRRRETQKRNRFEAEKKIEQQFDTDLDISEADFEKSVAELAIQQFLDDESVRLRDREIFRRTAIQHERPDSVAEAFGITRNNVDQIKLRALRKIREIALKLKEITA